MLETRAQRETREKAEAGAREARIREYESKMGVELPYSPVAVMERKPVSNVRQEKVTLDSNVRRKGFDKSAYQRDYMKEYRRREKKCPHCGGEL